MNIHAQGNGPMPALVQAQEFIKTLGALLSTMAIIVGFGWWLFGGFKPQTQVDVASLSSRVTAVEAAQKILTDNQTATLVEIKNTKDAILDRINSMPRPTDFSAQDAHLSRLDKAVDSLNLQLHNDEIDNVEIKTKVNRLWDGTNTPTRNTR